VAAVRECSFVEERHGQHALRRALEQHQASHGYVRADAQRGREIEAVECVCV
jgi:hypothetical protein